MPAAARDDGADAPDKVVGFVAVFAVAGGFADAEDVRGAPGGGLEAAVAVEILAPELDAAGAAGSGTEEGAEEEERVSAAVPVAEVVVVAVAVVVETGVGMGGFCVVWDAVRSAWWPPMRTWVMRCEKSEASDGTGGGAAVGRRGLVEVVLLLLASSSSSARSSRWLRLCESMATGGRGYDRGEGEGVSGCATNKKGGYGFGKSAEVQVDVVTGR